jgi:polar amino acid transport system substrate-binding protein
MHHRSRLAAGIAATALAALALSGCASTASSGSASKPSSSASAGSAAAKLPASIKSSGSITFANAFLSAPIAYADPSGKYIGVEPDLMAAVAKKLGVTLQTKKLAFASLVTAVQSGQADVAGDGLTDTADREGQADFVNYATTWSTILVKGGNPHKVAKETDLCGLKVMTLVATPQQLWANGLPAECSTAGKPAPTLSTTGDSANLLLAVSNGQVDAAATSHSVADSNVASADGKLAEVKGVKLLEGYVGFVVKKDSGLQLPLQAALNEVIKDGTYAKIMKKYGQSSAALPGEAPLDSASNPPSSK